ncbi:MAG: DNA polymerase III subunit delta' [Alphaproteobacteria bacterium]|nr:DNA polymerase III subunit delta' [Alphaproteobacteria bacterium]
MAKTEAVYVVEPLHPRRAEGLVGHARAWAAFSASLRTGRMPHAWLLVGPRGVGKATFAYKAAVEILTKGGGAPGRLDPSNQSILRRVAAGSHGDLLAVERDLDGGDTQGIPVAAVRDLRKYFGLTSAEAGWRVAIVDALDDLSIHGVNALLKVVEEPPPRALLFLLAHRAGAVPATIRSRCRRLPFAGLAPGECVQVLERLLPDQSPVERSGLAHLANGAPGLAFAFAEADALALFGEITGLCRTLPALDVPAAHAFSERFARRPGSERFSTFAAMFKIWVYRAAIRIVAGDSAVGADIVDGEGETQRQYSTAAGLAGVLSLWNDVGRIADAAIHAHLDRKQAVLDVLFASRRQARGV